MGGEVQVLSHFEKKLPIQSNHIKSIIFFSTPPPIPCSIQIQFQLLQWVVFQVKRRLHHHHHRYHISRRPRQPAIIIIIILLQFPRWGDTFGFNSGSWTTTKFLYYFWRRVSYRKSNIEAVDGTFSHSRVGRISKYLHIRPCDAPQLLSMCTVVGGSSLALHSVLFDSNPTLPRGDLTRSHTNFSSKFQSHFKYTHTVLHFKGIFGKGRQNTQKEKTARHNMYLSILCWWPKQKQVREGDAERGLNNSRTGRRGINALFMMKWNAAATVHWQHFCNNFEIWNFRKDLEKDV